MSRNKKESTERDVHRNNRDESLEGEEKVIDYTSHIHALSGREASFKNPFTMMQKKAGR